MFAKAIMSKQQTYFPMSPQRIHHSPQISETKWDFNRCQLRETFLKYLFIPRKRGLIRSTKVKPPGSNSHTVESSECKRYSENNPGVICPPVLATEVFVVCITLAFAANYSWLSFHFYGKVIAKDILYLVR